MLGQLNLWGKNKVEVAIERLQSFEPKDGYYLAFSGGKDSQCIYHLAKMAGVKFDAHYRVTGIDPPELFRFIRKNYPDVSMDIPRDDIKGNPKDNNRVTMWSLIENNTMPPTRKARYCCEYLKESGGEGRLTVTGVRWAESNNRKANQGEVTIMKTGLIKEVKLSPDFSPARQGGVVLVNDNTESRRLMEQCVMKGKVTLNPIIDWEDDDVWEFLNDWAKVPHCELYDQGFKRLGCIGCPMSGSNGMKRGFARWPKYKDLYIRAMQKMCDNHPGQIRTAEKAIANGGGTNLQSMGNMVFLWWMGELKEY